MKYFNPVYAVALLIIILAFLAVQFFIIGAVCIEGDEEMAREICGIGLEDIFLEMDRCPEGIDALHKTGLCTQAIISYLLKTTILIFAFNAVYAPAYVIYLRTR